jgi:CheY-like chemotaxis protein
MDGRSRVVAAILIVGDEPILLEALADQLIGWQVTASAPGEAVQFIRTTRPDLLILCQSIPQETAEGLIKCAREFNSNVRALIICRPGDTRDFHSEGFDTRLDDPGDLRTVVVRLLQSRPS